jgi:hypothetical protein
LPGIAAAGSNFYGNDLVGGTSGGVCFVCARNRGLKLDEKRSPWWELVLFPLESFKMIGLSYFALDAMADASSRLYGRAQLCPRTFCTFKGEFSSLSADRHVGRTADRRSQG